MYGVGFVFPRAIESKTCLTKTNDFLITQYYVKIINTTWSAINFDDKIDEIDKIHCLRRA